MSNLGPTDLIAAYAAVIATAALALELRRWFEGRPSYSLTINGPMVQADNPAAVEVVLATLTNRWDKPFSVDAFAVLEFKSIFHRLFLFRNNWNGLVLRPNYLGPLPQLVSQGEIWRGFIDLDDELRSKAEKRKVFIAVYCTFSDRPILKRVVLRDSAKEQ